MTDRTLEVQKAVVAALQGHPGFTAPIYDRPPQDTAFPYVSLGSTLGQPDVETQGSEGFEISMTFDTWSREPGRAEAADIMRDIYDVLHNSNLSLDAGGVVMTILDTQQIIPDRDGLTTHGVQRFTFVTDG